MNTQTTITKWERVFENENTKSIWKYNSKISRTNPYEITIEYKNEVSEKKKRTPKKQK